MQRSVFKILVCSTLLVISQTADAQDGLNHKYETLASSHLILMEELNVLRERQERLIEKIDSIASQAIFAFTSPSCPIGWSSVSHDRFGDVGVILCRLERRTPK